ncbi:BgtA-20286 [Blumeria graminis f. sp. tritici]|uniref:BgtA-20286 n=2 Tax=Blumeria graminis f. sp. tritici TaxID=62690 RepID=A0A9X9L709_BLUGR|nr:hypothetical protein BGT96224_A20286 [Blumeria graminis f. sp. tritici 96224]VCU38937.1 BgtA-20286 [Blumeria graminis f. sp. tritici]
MTLDYYSDVLRSLQDEQESNEPSFIKLGEPVSTTSETAGERRSDISSDIFNNLTLASLEADLEHYKELFSKLRFSYVEQVTKEKFIRAIVGDPPLVVEHTENIQLEESVSKAKSELNLKKAKVAELIKEIEKKIKELCGKYDQIQTQTTHLHELPQKIESLQARINSLRESQPIDSNPFLAMPLEQTLYLLETKEKERVDLDRQLEQLQAVTARKNKELERVHNELRTLEVKKLHSINAASEARKRKEESTSDIRDDLEEKGRWLRAVETGLKGILGIES